MTRGQEKRKFKRKIHYIREKHEDRHKSEAKSSLNRLIFQGILFLRRALQFSTNFVHEFSRKKKTKIKMKNIF